MTDQQKILEAYQNQIKAGRTTHINAMAHALVEILGKDPEEWELVEQNRMLKKGPKTTWHFKRRSKLVKLN